MLAFVVKSKASNFSFKTNIFFENITLILLSELSLKNSKFIVKPEFFLENKIAFSLQISSFSQIFTSNLEAFVEKSK